MCALSGLIFGALWSLPVVAILLNTETLLLLIGQEQQVASMAQQFTQYFLPGVPAYCWLFMIMRYLLCQVSLRTILRVTCSVRSDLEQDHALPPLSGQA